MKTELGMKVAGTCIAILIAIGVLSSQSAESVGNIPYLGVVLVLAVVGVPTGIGIVAYALLDSRRRKLNPRHHRLRYRKRNSRSRR